MNFFAATDSWVSIAVFAGFILLSAISNYLKKKQAEKSEPGFPDQSSSPRETNQPSSAPTRKAATWEEEIKKLLEDETEESVPPVLAERPRPVPRPPQPPALPPHLARNQLPRPAAPAPAQVAPAKIEPSEDEDVHSRLARLSESAAAYTRASQLTERVTERMKTVDTATEQVRPAAPVAHRQIAPDASQAVSLLRTPRSVRQVMIASIVLGPPKSLEV